MRIQINLALAAAVLGVGTLAANGRQASTFFPVDAVQPGMVGVGRTVFQGEAIEEFRANIVGVLRNVIGPGRDLILARLEGGPLASTGVIQGMSGSPVFIDGKLLGAVSYALGSFPKEPFAGITPIGEMVAAVSSTAPRANTDAFSLEWPASSAAVFGTLKRLAERAASPIAGVPRASDVRGPASLADLAPSLRPIGAAMVLGGVDPDVERNLREALSSPGAPGQAPSGRAARASEPAGALRGGDPVGVSLVRGDFEMGATGTVTYVDGNKVYAFGHPFLNLGPVTLAMTRAHVYAVLPSLDSSLKIASLGPVVGTMSQDRAVAIGGTLGAAPKELDATITLSSDRAPDRRFTFHVLQDPTLTPLFAYVAVINALNSYERQNGALSIALSGSISFGTDGNVAVDDFISGDGTATAAAAAVTAPIGVAATNEFRKVVPNSLDVTLRVSERQESSTIERVWLDTVKPRLGGTYNLLVLLRDFRGGTQTISVPVTMPAQASGPITVMVSDAATLSGIEQREIKPGKPTSFAALLDRLNSLRRGNRVYVRLLAGSQGTVVGGDALPALPGSVRSVLDTDRSVATAPLSRTIVGAWEQRLDRAVKGSRELTITLSPAH